MGEISGLEVGEKMNQIGLKLRIKGDIGRKKRVENEI